MKSKNVEKYQKTIKNVIDAKKNVHYWEFWTFFDAKKMFIFDVIKFIQPFLIFFDIIWRH